MGDRLKELYPQFITLQNPIINAIINVLIIILVGFVVWWMFNLILSRIEKRYKKRTFFEKNERFFFLVKKAGHYTILILLGVGLINLFHVPKTIENIFYAFMIMLLASFANSMAKDMIPYLEHTIGSKTKTKIDDVIFDLLKRFSTIIIYVTACLLALKKLGADIMPFVAGAGVAGIAIGFAAKDTLSNIIAGILLLIDRPFEVGDRIEVWTAPANSATWGDVLDVGLRATKIKTTDNIIIIIPNNDVITFSSASASFSTAFNTSKTLALSMRPLICSVESIPDKSSSITSPYVIDS